MKEKETCDPCERDFVEEVDRLVEEVDGYTRKDHIEKKEEVEAAFPTEGKDGNRTSDGCAGGK